MKKDRAALPALKLSLPGGQALNEDHAICRRQAGVRLLAAFDGCGGVGGRRYPQLHNRTGAHIASNLYAACLEEWFLENAAALPMKHTAEALDKLFFTTASDYHEKYLSLEPSAVTGSMVRTLPSTAAILLQYENSAALYWAGNTRGYLLTDTGLKLLTTDDTASPADAFESLYRDAPMHNYLCTDRPFRLHEHKFDLPKQGVLMLATDGAYHAVPTPMHFEALLLNTLEEATAKKQWKLALRSALQASVSDDATLILLPFGFTDYSELSPYFDKRRRHVNQAYILPAAQADANPRLTMKTLWDMYQKE